jgi:hypothetical protein
MFYIVHVLRIYGTLNKLKLKFFNFTKAFHDIIRDTVIKDLKKDTGEINLLAYLIENMFARNGVKFNVSCLSNSCAENGVLQNDLSAWCYTTLPH